MRPRAPGDGAGAGLADRRVQPARGLRQGATISEVAADVNLFRLLGLTTWRGSFGWDDYEPSPGVYDFDWLHRFAELAESRGITLRPYIAYTPEWAARAGSDSNAWNDPPRDVRDWYRFVRELASAMRRHHNIVSYEINRRPLRDS